MSEIEVYQLQGEKFSLLGLTGATLDEITSQLPAGLYTTFRTYESGHKVLGLEAHYERLFGPALADGIQPDVARSDLGKMLSLLTAKNSPGESRLRLILSYSDPAGAFFVAIQSFEPLQKAMYEKGIRVKTMPLVRSNPLLKSTSFIEDSQDVRQMVKRDGDVYEILLVRDGCILEGMTSNFYAVIDGVLTTAGEDILLGVTRENVLKMAEESKIPIDFRAVKTAEKIQEAFITSSSRGVVPVVMIDQRPVGNGKPGEISQLLAARYEQYVAQHAQALRE